MQVLNRGISAHTLAVVGVGLILVAGCSSSVEDGAWGGSGGVGGYGGYGAEVEGERRTSPGVAQPELANLVFPGVTAIACTLPSQCATGFCVDGFCCDNGCANKCMGCSAAKKGGGLDGICGSIAANTDPDNDCPAGECDGKNACKNYNGVACTSAAQCLSKYCVDGFCCGNICMGSCQACSALKKGGGLDGVCGSINVGTDPDNECNPGECNGSGACNSSPQPTFPNGTACTGASQCQSGYCADGVCCDSWCLGTCQACTAAKKNQGVDGVCGNIASDQDPDEECWSGVCNGAGVCKQDNGVPCSDKTQCLSNYCIDGFCCENTCNQMCYACSEAKKGQGLDGVCGPIVSGKDVEDECNPGECNGSGACNQPQTPQANGTTCVSDGQCASGHCVDGVCCDTACTGNCVACTTAQKGSGTNGTCGPIASETDPDGDCGGGKCDGTGACRYYNGVPCTAANQCFSNYCVDGVCCGNICTAACYACSATKKGQGSDGACGPIATTRDPDNECNPGECNGSGACNQPQMPTLANGAPCNSAMQCISGTCVDGVCCDTPCTETCKACSAAKKGSGADGICGMIAATKNPDNECSTGYCNGAGACVNFNGVACSSPAQCISTYCVDGNCCGNACTGTCLACTIAKRGGGYDGQCGPIAANTDPDDECAAGACNGSGACVATPQGNGTTCSSNAQCVSGHCVDGVCCNTDCSGSCFTCNLMASMGTCSPTPAGQSDPNGTPACNTTCDGNGTCMTGSGPCTTGSECTSRICNDLVCESPKPANGPLVWLTLRDGSIIADSVSGTPPLLTLTGISSRLTPGTDILVNGDTTRHSVQYPNSLDYYRLYGGFNAAGVPQLSAGYGPFAPYGNFTRQLNRGGTETTYARNGIQVCEACWPVHCAQYGRASASAGINDANQKGAIVETNYQCDTFGTRGFDVGDGIKMLNASVLVRYSSSGLVELKVPAPTDLKDPLVLGPLGEFHSVNLANNVLSIVKYDATATFAWSKSVSGVWTESVFDVDATGNILIGFSFNGSVDFGAGPLTASGNGDLGLVKLSPAGSVVWQKKFAGQVSDLHLVRAGSADIAMLMHRNAAMNLGTGSITTSTVLAKFDATGTALWHANLEGMGTLTLSADLAGSVYVGTSSPTADFGWGTPLANKAVAIAMAKYGTCTGPNGCKSRGAACSADTECSSGACTAGTCF